MKRGFETTRLFAIPQKTEVVFSADTCRPEFVFDNQRRYVFAVGRNNERPVTAFPGGERLHILQTARKGYGRLVDGCHLKGHSGLIADISTRSLVKEPRNFSRFIFDLSK